ncbi:MAG: ribonucleotide reductase N-terminal alpha domain-containing protein, partial [Anaerolineales bacterium]
MRSPSITRNGLLPTPPIPEGLPKVELTENARQVLLRRYVRRGDDGRPVETVEEMFWRVAWHVAKVEEQWGADVMARAIEYYHLLTSKKFFPNSPTFTGAGTQDHARRGARDLFQGLKRRCVRISLDGRGRILQLPL